MIAELVLLINRALKYCS